MCGRVTLPTPMNLVVERFMLDSAPSTYVPRYNIAPTQTTISCVLMTGS